MGDLGIDRRIISKLISEKKVWRRGLEWTGSVYGFTADFCGHSNEPSCSSKAKNFFFSRESEFRKDETAPWS